VDFYLFKLIIDLDVNECKFKRFEQMYRIEFLLIQELWKMAINL